MSDPCPCNRRVSRKWGSATLLLRAVKVRKRIKASPMTRTMRKAFHDRIGVFQVLGIERLG